jgi:hypothetical protein
LVPPATGAVVVVVAVDRFAVTLPYTRLCPDRVTTITSTWSTAVAGIVGVTPGRLSPSGSRRRSDTVPALETTPPAPSPRSSRASSVNRRL